ncbi:hypothetical protein E18064_110028 [Elizabethkingia anophelis]|nr:hypothetical protein E18064_110028 [Elizabethkingia anophelis]
MKMSITKTVVIKIPDMQISPVKIAVKAARHAQDMSIILF